MQHNGVVCSHYSLAVALGAAVGGLGEVLSGLVGLSLLGGDNNGTLLTSGDTNGLLINCLAFVHQVETLSSWLSWSYLVVDEAGVLQSELAHMIDLPWLTPRILFRYGSTFKIESYLAGALVDQVEGVSGELDTTVLLALGRVAVVVTCAIAKNVSVIDPNMIERIVVGRL